VAARLRLTLVRLWNDEAGATAVEYGLIVACIFLAIMGGLSLFANNENTMYHNISNAIGGATH
jgi:pilus assembly protein Flp/PilA